MTLNQVVRRIQKVALLHKQIRNFYYGNVSDFLSENKISYAACFLQDNNATIDLAGKAITYYFRLFLLDLVNVSEETQLNELDVQSDMMSVAGDLLAQFDYSTYTDWQIQQQNTATILRDEMPDVVAGVVVDIAVSVMYEKNVCAVPSEEETGGVLFYYSAFNDNENVQDKEFLFSKQIEAGAQTYTVDLPGDFTNKFIGFKEPIAEPQKYMWINTSSNYGQIPDFVFLAPVVDSEWRYYISRRPVVIDSANTSFTLYV